MNVKTYGKEVNDYATWEKMALEAGLTIDRSPEWVEDSDDIGAMDAKNAEGVVMGLWGFFAEDDSRFGVIFDSPDDWDFWMNC